MTASTETEGQLEVAIVNYALWFNHDACTRHWLTSRRREFEAAYYAAICEPFGLVSDPRFRASRPITIRTD